MVDSGPSGQKPRNITVPPFWWDTVGGALFEHEATLGSFGNFIAKAREQLELRLLHKTPDQLESVLKYLDQSRGDSLPRRFVEQCAPSSQYNDDTRPTIVTVSAFATSAYLAKAIVTELSRMGIDTLPLPYHGRVSTFTELRARTLDQELAEVRAAAYGAVKRVPDVNDKLNGVFPIGSGFSAGALKVLSVTLNAAEAAAPLPFKALLLTSMPPQLTNETLGPLLDGAYKAFRHARATTNPDINFVMPINLSQVFAQSSPWPKWLGTLDYAPLGALISIRRMQELISDKIKYLPANFPITVIHSEDDHLCSVDCAKAFFDIIPSRHKEFIVVPGPHLPLISEAVTIKNGLCISEDEATMHRASTNNIIFDCLIELMDALERKAEFRFRS